MSEIFNSGQGRQKPIVSISPAPTKQSPPSQGSTGAVQRATLVVGRGGTGKTFYCLKQIAKEIEEEPLGRAKFLLVPEHITYKRESELAGLTADKGFFNTYVFGFRRFCRLILLETGGFAKERIGDVGRRLILKKILEKREKELTIFRRSALKRGFTKTLLDAVKEMKGYRLTPNFMKLKAQETGGTILASKLKDLSVIAEDFAEITGDDYKDGEDLMELLVDKLPESRLIRDADVYVDGFLFFNPQERRVLREMLRLGARLHVTVLMDTEENSPDNTRPAGVFRRNYETFLMLRDMAEELGISPKIKKMSKVFRFSSESLLHMEKEFWGRKSLPFEAKCNIKILEAANLRLEAEQVLSEIVGLLRDGYRYRDIGILIRDEAYQAILQRLLDHHGIPYFTGVKRRALHHPLAELVRSSLEILDGFMSEPVFRALKTGFFPVMRDSVELLENYVLEFGIRGKKRWLAEDDWTLLGQGYEDKADGQGWPSAGAGAGCADFAPAEFLEKINFIRREAMGPIAKFSAAMEGKHTARERAAALYDYITSLSVPEQMMGQGMEDSQEDLLHKAENKEIYAGFIKLLDEMVEVFGDEYMSRKDFTEEIGEGIDALEFSLVPQGLDYVSVSSFEQNSLENIRALFIMGVNEGLIPRRSHAAGLFTDADRLRLKESGVEVPPGRMENSLLERHLIYRAFTLPRERLFLSYALIGEDSAGLFPSSLLIRLTEIFPQIEIKRAVLEPSTEDNPIENGRIYDKISARENLVTALRGKKEGRPLSSWWQDVYNNLLETEKETLMSSLAGLFAKNRAETLSPEITAKLFVKGGELRGSVTRFETYRSCPFKHFAKYGLGLKERQEYSFMSLDLGNLLHGVLKNLGEKLKSQGKGFKDIEEDKISRVAHDLTEEIAPKIRGEILKSSAMHKHQKERIATLLYHSIRRLSAFDKASSFHSQFFETKFGGQGGSIPPLARKLKNGVKLSINGQIDRLDFRENYFLVVDYKTGYAAINLIEVLYGLKLQLLTYLLVVRNYLLMKKEERLPAGMLYFFLRYPMLTSPNRISEEEAVLAIEKKLKMPGWVLYDKKLIEEMDPGQKFLKIRLSKTDVYSSDRHKVKTKEEFETLLAYTAYILGDTGEKILSGNIRPEPYKMGEDVPCHYCPYKAVCSFDLKLPGFTHKEIENLEDGEIMDTMEWIMKGNTKNGMDR